MKTGEGKKLIECRICKTLESEIITKGTREGHGAHFKPCNILQHKATIREAALLFASKKKC